METNKTKRLDLIKKKCCTGFTSHEIEHFLYVVEKTKLDPLMNQIYAVKMAGKLSIQTSIDGLRLLAERSGNYSPGEDVYYEYNDEGQIVYAKCTVKKRTEDGTWHTITSRAYWKEYAKTGAGGRFWQQLPHLMIAKCAEALALRKGFPQDLSGLYIKEEMDQASKDIVEYISSEQIDEIKEMVEKLEVEKHNQLLKVLNIKDLGKIPKDKYEKAIKFIRNYINKHLGHEKRKEKENAFIKS
jgi:phage recombination protein Bet